MSDSVSTYQLNSNNNDRFGFGLFLAVVIHVLVLYLPSFESEDSSAHTQNLDITLVTHFSEEEPVDVDFFAQANQQASGTLDDVAVPTSPDNYSQMDVEGNQGENTVDLEVSDQTGVTLTAVTTIAEVDELVEEDKDEAESEETEAAESSSSEALLARLDALRQEYAKRPKIGTLTSVAAKALVDAEYQNHLQERVIAVGNQNYPEESIAQSLFGSLRLMLTILPDGSLEAIDITESSGYPLLDSAAIEIARMASPFEPFNTELRQKYDKIQFIRTWQFLPDGTIDTKE